MGARPDSARRPRAPPLHGPGAADGADHIARLRAAATQRAERHHGGGDRVRLGPHQRVLPVAEVHDEEVAVHVEALPRLQRVLLRERQLPDQDGVAHGPDPEAGLAGTQGEVRVVVEDEELRVGQPDARRPPRGAPAGPRTPPPRSPPAAAWPRGTVRRLDARGLGLDRQRVAEVEGGRGLLDQVPVEVLADAHQAVGVLGVDAHEDGQAVGRRHHVVVHQPDAVPATGVRRLHADPEAARAADVLLAPDHLERQVVAGEHLLRVVAARVVHHDHGGDRVRLDDQGVEHPGEQVGPVVGDDDDGDGLGGLSHAGTSGGR